MNKMLTIISFCLAISCPILYNLIGSTIDSNGILQEPFFLIPLMFIFLTISIVTFLINAVAK